MSSEVATRRKALVTGGAKRIGREVALLLARTGFDVAITYRESKAEAVETSRAIAALGVRSFEIGMDQRDEESVRGAVAEVAVEFGGLDLLVNNAAVIDKVALDEMTLERWDRVFESNVRGPFLVAREALPHLKAARGRIVNLGSLGGSQAWPLHAHYCASKAAVHSLTQTMAKAFAPEVSVNCVAPGYIEMEPAEVAERFKTRTPMGRNGTAEEVAEAVFFFATGPHFITGQVLTVDGGLGL
jgi:NAD(P)-dependent dehydrogenase (short-subunit alcohol dehydrogenase family)